MNAFDWAAALDSGTLPVGCGRWSGRWRWPSTPLEGGNRGSLLVDSIPTHGPDPPASFRPLARLRIFLERLRARMSEELASHDSLGVSRALLLGEAAGGSAPGMLRRLGFVHTLSASGIHLYALSSLTSLLLKAALGSLGVQARFALACSRGVSWALWLFCWGLAGGRPGMLRPLLLVGLREAAKTAGLRWRPWAPLAAALGVDLAAGLLHGAVTARGLGYGLAVVGGLAGLRAGKAGVGAELALATGSWVFLACLEAWQDSTVALATPVLSMITIPAVSFGGYPLLVLAALARALGLEPLSSGLASAAARGITTATALLARASMALPTLWVLPRGPLLLGAAVAAGLTVFVGGQSGARRRALIVSAVVSLCLALALRPLLGQARSTEGGARELRQLSVGQGDAALVVGARGSAGLIDVGSEHAVADSRWIGLLAHSGVTRLDWVALTHLDEDHAGGLHLLLRLLPIACAETAREQWESPRGQRLARLLASDGTVPALWGSGCVPYPTLAPIAVHSSHDANAAMGAVWIPLGLQGSYLSAGDATARDEPRIGLWARSLSESWENGARGWRILKVSHHGSKTSSAPKFLAEFAPDELWISVGRGNLYGHPDPGVLERLESLGHPVRRTDLEGELQPKR